MEAPVEPVPVPPVAGRDLTTGSLNRHILRLALPAVGMMHLQALYQIIDTFWVGKLGSEALAGISTGGFILWMIFALINVVSVGTQASIARRIGEGDRAAADETARQGVLFALITSVVLGAVLLAVRVPLFGLMNTSPEVARQGLDFLTVMIWGIATLFLSFVLTSIFQAAGDTFTPMKLMGMTLVLNAGLAPALMFGWLGLPAMGIRGTALSTVIARGVFAVVGLALLVRGRSGIRVSLARPVRIDWRLYGRVLRIGTPASLAGILFAAVYMALVRYVKDFGDVSIAALRIGHTAEFTNFSTCLGFAAAAATLVGQNLGAGRPDRAQQAVHRILVLLSAAIGAVTVAFLALPGPIVRIFSADPRVIAAGTDYLIILAYSQVFMGIETALAGGFSGAGDTLPPTLVSVPLTLLRVPLAWALTYRLGMGVDGIWWAISGTTILKAVVLLIWFRAGRWKHARV
jgi:putative MATE family efflux protein